MPSLEARVRAWSHRRQGLGTAGSDVLAALAEVVAVYATQPTATLSLSARVAGLSGADYRRIDHDRSAVRIPAMRSSSHLVPTTTAARVAAATRRPPEALDWIWRGVGLTETEYREAGAAIVASAREPVTVAGLRALLPRASAALLDRHPQAATMLVRALRSEGTLVALAPTSLRSNAFAYVATDAWLGRPLEPLDTEDALAWLAGEYLRGFGPARIADFRWWAGVTPGRARAAIARQPTIDVGGGLLLPTDDRDGFESARPLGPDVVDVVPLWDVYTMGYAPDGRSRLVEPNHLDRVYSGGDGRGLVLRAGSAVAAWGLRFTGRRMEVRLDLFGPPTPGLRAAIDLRLEPIAALLGASDLVVSEGSMRGRTGWG